MIELKGKYTNAQIMIDDVEEGVIEQIYSIINSPTSKGLRVVCQADAHPGSGICVGFTMELGSYLNPLHLGVDLNCGLLGGKFSSKKELNLAHIESEIRKRVPTGFNLHQETICKEIPYEKIQQHADIFIKKYNEKFNTSYVAPIYNEKWLDNKLKQINMDQSKFWLSIGTMGGNNHFIEIGKSKNDGDYWVVVHSGSRNFGLKIANYWTNVAKGNIFTSPKEYNTELDDIKLNTYPKNLIPKRIRELKEKYNIGINKEYLSGDNMINYLYDVIFTYHYSLLSRTTMLEIISDILNIDEYNETISTVHNYIDSSDMIIRKGSVKSYTGEKFLLPFNMKDGILICEGKSSSNFNFSAPHGSGRKFSRSEAKKRIDLKDFKDEMDKAGIYTTSVTKSTCDESPESYKSSELIESLIQDTAVVIDRIKPILNIKNVGKSIS